METALLWIVAVSCVLNLVLVFFLGIFVVRSHEQMRAMIGQLAEIVLGDQPVSPSVDSSSKPKAKTWDEKYEDELEAMQRRIRAASGLLDLPSGPSYDSTV